MAELTPEAGQDPLEPIDLGLKRVPTQQRARQKVHRALEAAQALLEREGVGALSLPRVAQEADVSVGALYQYLPDRDAIVAALSVLYHAQLERRMDQLVAAVLADAPEDPLPPVLAGLADVYRRHGGTRRMRVELQMASDPELTRAHKQRMVAKIQRMLATYGVPDPDRHAVIARTLFFAADGVMHEAFAERPDGDGELLAELQLLLDEYLALKDPDGPGPTRLRQ